MRKKRGYTRDTPEALARDYKLFAISCEGSEREPGYFKIFPYMSGRIAVDIIEEIVRDEEMLTMHSQKSAPKWLLDRAVKYIEKEGLVDDDELWFVMDKDRWSDEQLRSIAQYCDDYPNWHIVISNPCFEVWLYFHKKADISKSKSANSKDFKKEISTMEKGGYHPHKFIPNLLDAIKNARLADANNRHFLPAFKQTKVYQLGDALIEIIGKNSFDDFIKNRLFHLISIHIERAKLSTRKKK